MAKTKSPTTNAEVVEAIRARVLELQGERKRLEESDASREEIEAKTVTALTAQADVMRRQIGARMNEDGAAHALVLRDPRDLGPTLAALLGVDVVAQFLMRAADGCMRFGPPAAEKAARLAEIAAELELDEIEEESLIEASESTDAPILRRADARLEIVLALPDEAAK